MRTKFFVISVVLIVAVLYLSHAKTAVAQTIAPCIVGHTSPSTGFWTWPANSLVNIYLRDPDFSQDYVAAVRLAVENWDAAAVESGSARHFILYGTHLATTTTRTALSGTPSDTNATNRLH